MSEAMNKHPDADVMINFASLRSAYDATIEAMSFPQVRIRAGFPSSALIDGHCTPGNDKNNNNRNNSNTNNGNNNKTYNNNSTERPQQQQQPQHLQQQQH